MLKKTFSKKALFLTLLFFTMALSAQSILQDITVSLNSEGELCSADVFVPVPTFNDNDGNEGSTAFSFDGINNYGKGPKGVVPVTGEYTVSVWAKQAGDLGQFRNIFAQGRNLYLGQSNTGTIRVGDYWGNTGVEYPDDNKWHHFAVVRKIDDTHLYIDGVLMASKGAKIPSPGPNATYPSNFMIGSQWFAGEYFDGNIDEIQVWNYAQSKSLIAGYMNMPLLGNELGLVAYYDFEDNEGSSTITDIANGNDATILNADIISGWIASEQPISNINIRNDFNNTFDASGTYPVGTTVITWSFDDGNGNVRTANQNVTVNDNEAPQSVLSTNDSTVSVPRGSTVGWDPWVHKFNLPIPAGANVTGVNMRFRAVDQGWGGSGGRATFKIAGETIGSSILFHDERSYTIDYSGSVPNYSNIGSNQLEMFFLGYPGWKGYFKGGTMTISYNVNAEANNVTVYLDANGNASVNASDIDPGITDNCGIASRLLSQNSFDCSNIGGNNIILTVTDTSNNSSNFPAIVTIKDTIDPKTPTLADVIGQCDATATVPTTIDNCAGTINGTTLDPLTYDTQGTYVITWSFDDGNRNIITAKQNVIVEDNIDPTVNLNGAATITLNQNETFTETAEAADNCSATLVTAGTVNTAKAGSYVITYDVEDASGNKGTQVKRTVKVLDTTPPKAIAKDIEVQLDANGNASITPGQIDNGSSDDSGNVTLSLDKNTFDCDDVGGNGGTVNLDISDQKNTDQENMYQGTGVAPSSGKYWNTASQVAIQSNLLADDGITITPVSVGFRNFKGEYSWSGELPVNDRFYGPQHGTSYIDITGLDPMEKYDLYIYASYWGATYSVPNLTSEDAQPTSDALPYIEGNQYVLLEGAVANDTGAITITVKANGSDEWTNIGALQIVQNGGNSTETTLTVTDPSGNESTATATVTVVDKIAPTLVSKPISVTLAANGAVSIVANDVLQSGSDNCGTVTYALSQSTFSATDANNSPITVQLTGIDASENKTTVPVQVTVVDPVPIVKTQNITVELDEKGAATINAADIDNGSSSIVGLAEEGGLSIDISSFDCSDIGEVTVTLTATSTLGSITTGTATVAVEDNIAPTAVAQDFTITLDEFGSATITAENIDNGSSDNCAYTPSIDVTTFDCTNIGMDNTVTLTVTDAARNMSVAKANITVLEHFKATLDLRSLSSFEAFTGTGAIANAGALTGNVGTNAGALTGFTGPSFTGNTHFNNALSVQADIDLMKVYIHLNNIFETHPGTHAPAFGSGETLTPGVYSIGGAGSVAGTLTLDGQGDPNAVFIMKFKGAFTAGAATNINLINNANAANVYWVAQGAISIGAASTIKGTLLAYPGAITLGVNSSIEGRLLSSVGAITIAANGMAIMPAGIMNIPIKPMVSYTPAAAVDVLGSIENFSLFTSNGAVANASTSGIIGDVGADIGAITGFATSSHIGSFYNADAVTAQAKIDLNNAYSELMMIPNTVSSHTPAFGSGETLPAGVYTTAGAGSLAGTITLDGAGDEDAIFIFKFNGAFAAGAQSRVILSNGTRRCNVFWISEGAASIGSFSTIKGTVIANKGAATMGAGGNLEGRLLSTGGAIGFSTSVVYTVVHDKEECDSNLEQKTSSKSVLATKNNPESINEILVYPNPSNGIFNIKLSVLNIKTDVYVIDTAGRIIANESISKENNTGNLIRIGNNNLSSGIYLVKIITKHKAVTKKVIIETSN